MSENRRQILDMLAQGKITADEAERLIAALEKEPARAGVRLGALIPPQARDRANAALREQGVPFDLNQIKPENIEELIEQLNDLSIDVVEDRAKVRIFCE